MKKINRLYLPNPNLQPVISIEISLGGFPWVLDSYSPKKLYTSPFLTADLYQLLLTSPLGKIMFKVYKQSEAKSAELALNSLYEMIKLRA